MTKHPITQTPTTGKWTEQKSRLKAIFTTLLNSDLHSKSGEMEEMLKRIGEKTGKTKEEILTVIKSK